MPSSIAHGLTAAALGSGILLPKTPRRIWIVGVLAAILIDIDAIGRPFQRGDIAWMGGHRALTHSLLFAILLGAAMTAAMTSRAETLTHRLRVALFLICATAAHGILDAFTTDGSGVAFLSPFSHTRYLAPWRPIDSLHAEIIRVWLPALVFMAALARWRRARSRGAGR